MLCRRMLCHRLPIIPTVEWIKQDSGMIAVANSKVINVVFPINLTTIYAALASRTNPVSGDWSGIVANASIQGSAMLSLAIYNRGNETSNSNFYVLIIGR